MLTDAAGALWPIIQVAGPVLLVVALAYGTIMYSRRSARLNQEAHKETKRLYQKRDP